MREEARSNCWAVSRAQSVSHEHLDPVAALSPIDRRCQPAIEQGEGDEAKVGLSLAAARREPIARRFCAAHRREKPQRRGSSGRRLSGRGARRRPCSTARGAKGPRERHTCWPPVSRDRTRSSERAAVCCRRIARLARTKARRIFSSVRISSRPERIRGDTPCRGRDACRESRRTALPELLRFVCPEGDPFPHRLSMTREPPEARRLLGGRPGEPSARQENRSRRARRYWA